uniref:Uncharacterized protein n=2 Tax=Canis lupus familiaris TaxID=9615 RepID=A0A8C0RS19_CANLF
MNLMFIHKPTSLNYLSTVYRNSCCLRKTTPWNILTQKTITGCRSHQKAVPQESSVPNGIKCPACYNVYDVSCDPVLLACTGTETKRVEVIGIDSPIFMIFAMGCATETVLNLRNISILNNIKIRTNCTEQSNGDPH